MIFENLPRGIFKNNLKTIMEFFKLIPSYLGLYKIRYILSYIKFQLNKTFNKKFSKKYDLVFIMSEPSWCKGLILERICREIAKNFPGKVYYSFSIKDIPPSKKYWFAHYSFLHKCLKSNIDVWGGKLYVWYTHPRDAKNFGISSQELFYSLNKADKIICPCSSNISFLSQNLPKKKLKLVLGGLDPKVFKPHKRSKGVVGLCSDYYERKNPKLIYEIIKKMKNRKFILLGKNWNTNYDKFNALISLPNFKYINAHYKEYPKYFAKMDVFFSASTIEGGPIPLLEAMASNTVPVVSNTGFASDIIVHGKNGFIFEIDDPVEKICRLIEKAYKNRKNIANTVKKFTWDNFSKEINKILLK